MIVRQPEMLYATSLVRSMTDLSPSRQLHMPKLRRLKLERFSLYKSKPVIEVAFPDGVFCLVGANGLGKSTFLAAVNYALTGIVPDPDRKFESVREYYEFSRDFADEFFDGRIAEKDRDAAQVSIEFLAGSKEIQITRGAFDREQLRRLSVTDAETGQVLVDGKRLSAEARHKKFAAILSEEIGLISFEQFVFLQHFVFTFDERRHLLFWDQAVLEQTMYLCFGINPKDAAKADSLRREVLKADSLVRNYQWQATGVRTKIEHLEEVADTDIEGEHFVKLLGRYEKLKRAKVEAETAVQTAREQLEDSELKYAQLTGAVATLTAEYEREFGEYFAAHQPPEAHPLVSGSIQSIRCGLCGTSGENIVQAIKQKLEANSCPLCGSTLKVRAHRPDTLKKIDTQLAQAKDDLSQAMTRRQRIAEEQKRAEVALARAVMELDQFERENRSLAEGGNQDNPNALQRTIAGYREQLEALLSKKETQYRRREDKKKHLRQFQRKLLTQYADAQERFVPDFKELAQNFLGLDLDIRVEQKAAGVFLTLTVNDTARRKIYQLSESQRFFVDIALRMALIKYTAAEIHTGCLLIDTPEGSLDIAYETKAGEMFAKFALAKFNIIMTANINTSKLLLNLAKRCGKSKMRLHRMTSWTELSEVQRQEEHLFREAFTAIERELEKSGTSTRRVHSA